VAELCNEPSGSVAGSLLASPSTGNAMVKLSFCLWGNEAAVD
jgi:hypothetical protein